MDLLGDIGQEDQLTSAREENRVLQAKVKELTVRVHELNAKNAALLAEVELYRAEFASKSSSGVGESVGEDSKEALVDDGADEFVTAGNGSVRTVACRPHSLLAIHSSHTSYACIAIGSFACDNIAKYQWHIKSTLLRFTSRR